jgi:glucuronoarabinoxylan endo-1,4-beta-xylanase
MRTPLISVVLLSLAPLLVSCIGVYGQTPEIASMKDAEAQQQAGAGTVDDSLGAQAGTAHLNINATRQYQTLEGFGAATAWYMDRIVGPTTGDLYDFLFAELGLDILRFRNRFERVGEENANLKEEIEIFKRATAALGHPPKLMLSSWSPSGSLKAHGKEKCSGNPDCTLKKVDGKFVYDEYADWWLRSLKHYQSLGLTPDYISMQNEPSFIPPDWEGCKFEPAETAEYPGYGKALSKLHGRLSELSFQPKVLGPETLGVHYERTQKYLKEIDRAHLYGVAHHLYEKGNDDMWDWRDPGPDSYVDEMLGVAASTELPIFQTEFNTDEDKGIDGGFETAWLIHHTMAEEGAAAFLYWDLIWPDKGLVSMTGRTPNPRDQYYALKHFSRYTDPGYVRVSTGSDAEGIIASAYLAQDKRQLTVVVLNTGKGVVDVTLSMEGFEGKKSSSYQTVFRPGKSKRWVDLGSLSEESSLHVPARSVTTVVLTK